MTCELYTFGKWHTAASYKKPPAPCGASHLFFGGGGCKKTGAKFIIRDTAKQVGEHKDSLLRQKQGRDAHLGRKGGHPHPPSEEEPGCFSS